MKNVTVVLLSAYVIAANPSLVALQTATPGQAKASLTDRPATNDLDADGDGLCDYHELHKYRTDPRKKDTAGKGSPDGAADARRQFTYSIRSVHRVMPPYNKATLTDDYQDVRILAETKGYLEIEVISYPFNTNAGAICGNPTWKRDYAGMKEYLDAGVTTNWDVGMQQQLLHELAQAGIYPDWLTDREVVEKVSAWLFQTSKHQNMFCTFFVHFPESRPAIYPGLEAAFDREKGDRRWSVQEQFEHELFGKDMFRRRTYGTCTSTAVYQCTVLRALGIPCRMLLAIPVVDASDAAQLERLQNGLRHHQVRSIVYEGVLASANAFASHTFLEVYVGHRWRRLNFRTLGQNTLDRNLFGLLVKVHTFRDLSEANLAATWGQRFALGRRDEPFTHHNPYRCLEISDHFGAHVPVPNPPVKEHQQLTITRAYWVGSKNMPEALRKSWQATKDGAGRLLLHGEEWFHDADYRQYKAFMKRADPDFVFRAPGKEDVKGRVSMSFYTDSSADLREMEVVIPQEEFAKMARGVPYTILAVNAKRGYTWRVRDGLTITRE